MLVVSIEVFFSLSKRIRALERPWGYEKNVLKEFSDERIFLIQKFVSEAFWKGFGKNGKRNFGESFENFSKRFLFFWYFVFYGRSSL